MQNLSLLEMLSLDLTLRRKTFKSILCISIEVGFMFVDQRNSFELLRVNKFWSWRFVEHYTHSGLSNGFFLIYGVLACFFSASGHDSYNVK